MQIETGPFVGTLRIAQFRVSIVPKIGFGSVMEMIRYSHSLSPTALHHNIDYEHAEYGLADLLAEALLLEVERLARRGLSAFYREQSEALSMPRGRICMKSAAARIGRIAVECRYDDFTSNVALNQTLAEGLWQAARVVVDRGLRFRLLRARDRYLAEQDPIVLNSPDVERLLSSLDRRTSHYRASLIWIKMLVECCRLGRHQSSGESPQFGFLVDMNLLFERFLERFFQKTAPAGYAVSTQESFSSLYHYTRNPRRWNTPTVRPDLVFHQRGRVIAVGDAKYKDRSGKAPSASELYQLTMYGLMFRQRGPRKVFLFHPLARGREDRTAMLEFQAPGVPSVGIVLVGVPVERILRGDEVGWGDLFNGRL